MIIILLGYMGSGKSTVGQILAEKLKFDFADLDNLIEIKEGSSIEKIFETKGEIYFRKKESIYLKEFITNSSFAVLSLGGGTPCYASNMSLIKESKGISIYLKTSITSVLKRLSNQRERRPLISHLSTDEELCEFIGKHLFERQSYYNQSHFTISTDNKTPGAIADEIISLLA